MNNHNNDLFNLGPPYPQYPPPFSPTRNIELVRTEVSISGPCCACLSGAGKLTCSMCKAIKYCDQDCQKKGSPWPMGKRGWEEHKATCNNIKERCKETVDAGEALANAFGGTDVLLQSPLVTEGRFKFNLLAVTDNGFSYQVFKESLGKLLSEPLLCFREHLDGTFTRIPHPMSNPQERYILARLRLIESFVKCGEEALSNTAFRLAAENMLDLLCLTYSKPSGEQVRCRYAGWMVAGGMDQEALNYICYFQHRLLSTHPLPYLDMSNDEDIEGDSCGNDSCFKMLEEKIIGFRDAMWFHDFMLIALIKYKRLEALVVQMQKNKIIWRTFMMGTHPRAGDTSVILRIRGKTPIIERIKSFLMEESINSRVNHLINQIKQILNDVNKRNPLIIRGIIDKNSIPKGPPWNNIHDAVWAFGYYGHAWNMSSAYAKVLRQFLDTGNLTCMASNDPGRIPMGGFLQAAFNVDSTRFFGHKDDLSINGMF